MRHRLLTLGLRALLLVAALGALGVEVWWLRRSAQGFDPAMGWLGLSLLLLILGVWDPWPSLAGMRGWPRRAWQALRAHGWEVALVVLLLGVATFMRVYRFGDLPPANGLGFEEYQTGGVAHRALREGFRPYEFPLTGLLPAATFALFGENTFALRLPFLILGVATLVPFYLLARALFRWEVALFVTALLAVSRWHGLVSRFADELFTGIFVETLLLCLLVQGLRTRKAPYFVGVGALAGCLAYEYTAYRIVPFLVAAYLAWRVLAGGIRWAWHRRHGKGEALPWRTAALSALAFLVALGGVLAPLILLTLRGETLFTEAFLRHGLDGTHPGPEGLAALFPQARERLARTLQGLLTGDVGAAALSVPGTPLLEPVSAVLVVVGMLYTLATVWRPYRGFLVAWIALSLFTGAVLPQNLYLGRFSALIPLFYLVVGFPLDDVGRFLRQVWPRARPAWAAAVLVPLFLAEAALSTHALFVVHLHDPIVQQHYDNYLLALCTHLQGLGDEPYVYIWAEQQPLDFLFRGNDYSWACQDPEGAPMFSPLSALPVREVPSGRTVAVAVSQRFWEPEAFGAMAAFYYPEVRDRVARVERPGGNYRVVTFSLTQEEIAARQGLTGQYAAAGMSLSRVDPFEDGHWSRAEVPDLPAEGPLQARWSGLLFVQEEGVYRLRAEAPTPVSIQVDGRIAFAAQGTPSAAAGDEGGGRTDQALALPAYSEALPLSRGWHLLQVDLDARAGREEVHLSWGREGAPFQPVRREDLFALPAVQGLVRRLELEGQGGQRVALQRLEPTVLPLTVPLLVQEVAPALPEARFVREEWSGWLHADAEGEHLLRLRCWAGEAVLRLDGEEVLRCTAPRYDHRVAERGIPLRPGEYALTLTYTYADGILAGAQVLWRRPGRGDVEPLLPEVLTPLARE
ncbi:MAG: ArnT family glycosyltransferase [Anaerolineae bacterium]